MFDHITNYSALRFDIDMKTNHNFQAFNTDEGPLCWTMRIVGLTLTLASVIFLTQEIFTSTAAMLFFGFSAGLGVVTVITSWVPGPDKQTLQESPVYNRVRNTNQVPQQYRNQ